MKMLASMNNGNPMSELGRHVILSSESKQEVRRDYLLLLLYAKFRFKNKENKKKKKKKLASDKCKLRPLIFSLLSARFILKVSSSSEQWIVKMRPKSIISQNKLSYDVIDIISKGEDFILLLLLLLPSIIIEFRVCEYKV